MIGRTPWHSAFLIAILALAATGCGEIRTKPRSAYSYYQVQQGDTLYSIARRLGYRPGEIAMWNGISEPFVIYPGDQLIVITPHDGQLPTIPLQVAKVKEEVRKPSGAVKRPESFQAVETPAPTRAKPVQRPPRTRVYRWQWPVHGKLLRRFAGFRWAWCSPGFARR